MPGEDAALWAELRRLANLLGELADRVERLEKGGGDGAATV